MRSVKCRLNRKPSEAECPGWLISESEDKLQRELHYPRIACQSGDSTRGGVADVVLTASKLRRVQHIEHLPTKLQAAAFPEPVDPPAQPHIDVRLICSAQPVAPAPAHPRLD